MTPTWNRTLLFSLLAFATLSPARADYVQQGPRLIGAGSLTDSHGNGPVAISGDGNTALVSSLPSKAVYAFVRSNGIWTQQQMIGVPSDGNPCCGTPPIGTSLALSNDGNTAAVGGAGNKPSSITWIFTRSHGVWSEQQKLLVSGSVAISGDGNTVVIGDPYDTSQLGAAHVYTRSGGFWAEQAKLTANNAIPFSGTVQFGVAVAISSDGQVVAAGGPYDNGANGAVWVFSKSGNSWQQTAKLVAPAAAQTLQGSSVALSGNGSVLAESGLTDPNGSAWVFTKLSGVWQSPVTLAGFHGGSVAISSDGNTVVAGGAAANSFYGAASVYLKSGGSYQLLGVPHFATTIYGAGGVCSALFYQCISVSSDASTFIAGGSEGPGNASQKAGYVFINNPSLLKTHTGTLYQGQTNASYLLRVVSQGPAKDHGSSGQVAVNEEPPAGFTITGMSGTGWNCPGHSKMCMRNDALPAGQTYPAILVTGTVAPNAPLNLVNTATVAVHDGDAGPNAGTTDLAVLRAPGGVVQWGSTASGQAAPPAGLNNVVAVAAGCNHSLALKGDGKVVQWGATASGQGAPPAGLSDVIAISAGCYHSLALKSDGTVVQWGLPIGGPPAISHAIAIAGGGFHSLALLDDGTVVQWGDGNNGEGVPPNGLHAVAIAAGFYHSLAIQSDGTVAQWGPSGVQGVPPAGLNNVKAIAAGQYHSLALRLDGSVIPWGPVYGGQATPASNFNITAIAAGFSDSLALRIFGALDQWGDTTQGQGAPPAGLLGASGIAAGAYHKLAILAAPASLSTCSNFVCPGAPDRQYTPVNQPFYNGLSVKVTDPTGVPLANVPVTFTVHPVNGAGATVGGGSSAVVMSAGQGFATLDPPVANGVSGSYTVVATIAGVPGSATFPLTNVLMTITGGNNQSTKINTAFPTPLQVRVTVAGAPLAGQSVTFACGVTNCNLSGSDSTVTDANGFASMSVSADSVATTYQLPVFLGGGKGASFTLTNLP